MALGQGRFARVEGSRAMAGWSVRIGIGAGGLVAAAAAVWLGTGVFATFRVIAHDDALGRLSMSPWGAVPIGVVIWAPLVVLALALVLVAVTGRLPSGGTLGVLVMVGVGIAVGVMWVAIALGGGRDVEVASSACSAADRELLDDVTAIAQATLGTEEQNRRWGAHGDPDGSCVFETDASSLDVDGWERQTQAFEEAMVAAGWTVTGPTVDTRRFERASEVVVVRGFDIEDARPHWEGQDPWTQIVIVVPGDTEARRGA